MSHPHLIDIMLRTDLLKAVGRVAKSNGRCGQRDLASTCVAPFLSVCVPNLPQGRGWRLVGVCWSLVRGAILDEQEETKLEETVRMKSSED